MTISSIYLALAIIFPIWWAATATALHRRQRGAK